MPDSSLIISPEIIENRIYLIRGKKVMFDHDLSMLYGVETRRLNEQVKRNIKRFPEEFMFQLTNEEFLILKSQIATSSWGGIRKPPLAFTEHGILMLSSVLSSDKAIEVNIQIMKIFIRIREMLVSNTELRKKIEEMEGKYDKQFKIVFDAIRQIIKTPENKTKKIGFKP